MGFNYNGTSFGDIRVGSAFGRPGLGVSTLHFSMEFHLAPYAPQGVTVRDIEISVAATRDTGGNPAFLGMARPERPWEFEVKKGNPSTQRFLFQLSMLEGQLFALEDLRQGHGLTFHLSVNALTDGPQGTWEQHEVVQHMINLTAWSKVLAELGGGEYVTVGIPIPSAASPLTGAVGLLRKAHGALLNGHYDTVVSQCRLAIDSAQAITGDNKMAEEIFLAFQRDRTSMTKVQREIFIGQAARHYAHVAHHADDAGRVETFSRDEALFMLAVCAGVLSSTQRREQI